MFFFFFLKEKDAIRDMGVTGVQRCPFPIPAPAGDIFGNSRLQSGVMLTADAAEDENFVAMMQFIDWLYYSDEGLEFAKWGVEGETFTTEGGERKLAPDVDWLGLNPTATKNLRTDFGFYNEIGRAHV